MKFLHIKNWKKFQHYKGRCPPWVKLHFEIFTSADWVGLDDTSKLLAVACMLIGSRYDGKVPNDPAYIRRVAYLNKAVNLKPLIDCGFLSETLADDSDCKQMLAPGCSETDTEVEKKEKKEAAPDGAPDDPSIAERELFERGKQVLGKSAGGMIANLLRAKGGNVALARSAIEMASQKSNPREWLAAATGPPRAQAMTLKEIKQQEWREAYQELKDAANRTGNGSESGGEIVRLLPADSRQ